MRIKLTNEKHLAQGPAHGKLGTGSHSHCSWSGNKGVRAQVFYRTLRKTVDNKPDILSKVKISLLNGVLGVFYLSDN